MSDKHYMNPCGECNQYYGHHDKCSIHSETGIFEKLVTRRIEQEFAKKHRELIHSDRESKYQLSQQSQLIDKCLEVIEFTYETDPIYYENQIWISMMRDKCQKFLNSDEIKKYKETK